MFYDFLGIIINEMHLFRRDASAVCLVDRRSVDEIVTESTLLGDQIIVHYEDARHCH